MDDDASIEAGIDAEVDAEIRRLAGLSDIKYEQERKHAAEKLGITRVSVLDKAVKQSRLESCAAQNGHDELVVGLEPWDSPVDGNALALEAVALLRKHTVQTLMAYEAIALWCIGAYAYDNFRIFPRLTLHSPMKRCGKTTTLEVIEALVPKALIGSNVSASVIFRAIEAWHPTILADEADTWIHENEELRGIINSGHNRRTARVFRTEEVDGQRVPVAFSTWAPLALAMIKTPPDTIMDRSVVVNLRRRAKSEHVTKIPTSLFDDHANLRRKLLRWAVDNADTLRHAQPTIPFLDNDRAMDNWHPLFAIAEALGGNWTTVVSDAMNKLERSKPDDEEIGAMLLSDIQGILSTYREDSIFSEELVSRLIEIESRPWCEWRRGSPMTKNSLAKLLVSYRIVPNTVRGGSTTKKGYYCSAFADAFNRYIAPAHSGVQNVTTSQTSTGTAPERSVCENQNVTNMPETSQRHKSEQMFRSETSQRNTNGTAQPSGSAGCDDVTDGMLESAGNTPSHAEGF